MTPEISVIIPTRNEALNLPDAFAALEFNGVRRETIVVDAGSDDATLPVATGLGAIPILSEKAHRAHQLNLGAARAASPVMLFLHADTRLPPGALDRVVSALLDSPVLVGGGFARRFDSPSGFLRLTTALASLRSRHFGLFLGDQAIFVRRSVFDELSGFDESLCLCEDLDFSRRLRARGQTVTLAPPALSSARRFEARGPLRTTLGDVLHAWRYYRERRRS